MTQGGMNLSCNKPENAYRYGSLPGAMAPLAQAYVPMQVSAAPLPDAWRGLVYLNPMTGILAMYRRGLLGLELVPGPESLAAWGAPAAAAPSAWWLAASAASVALVFVLGLVALRRGDRDFGDVL